MSGAAGTPVGGKGIRWRCDGLFAITDVDDLVMQWAAAQLGSLQLCGKSTHSVRSQQKPDPAAASTPPLGFCSALVERRRAERIDNGPAAISAPEVNE